MQLWDGTRLEADTPAEFLLVFRQPGTLRRIFRPPIELHAAEAFIRGEFDAEGDITKMFALMGRIAGHFRSPGDVVAFLRARQMLPSDDTQFTLTRGPAQLTGAVHSKDRDQAAIQYHYDVGNAFYALFLDRRMNYTCAYFPGGNEDLDTAQEAKLDMICRKLRLRPGERLLDIGCGWGGLLIWAGQHHGVHGLGVTLSQKQHELANQRIAEAGLSDRIKVELRDYRDLGDATFDKVASIGMFEHVGRSHLPEYFAHAYRVLKPGGVFLNHGISRGLLAAEAQRPAWWRWVDRQLIGSEVFRQRYVFPDGELEAVSDINLMAEQAGFEVRDVENWREHYSLTLRHWIQRLETCREEAVRLAGDTTYRTWRLYMASSAYSFDIAYCNVNQTVLSKLDGARSGLPLSRLDWYR